MISHWVQQLLQFDHESVNWYRELIDAGKYARLHLFCRWIGLPVQLTAAYLLIGAVAYFTGGWRLVILEAVTIVFTNLVNLTLKAIFKRERPSAAIFWSPLPKDHYAFPSGHAATCLSIAIALGCAAGGWMWVLLPWGLFMGVSRFFGDLHYPTDILGGFAVGMITGFIAQLGTFLIW